MLHIDKVEMPLYIDDLPSFQSNSDLSGLPFLSEYDIDENLPNTIHSRYFTVSELASLDSSNSQLSILHTNIRSLSRHSDELVQLCIDAEKSFDIIGVSEIWNSEQNEIRTNVDISGYKFYDTSSTSQNGGVGLYVKTTLNSRTCDDLNFKCNGFETIWVEIDNKYSKNFLFCCTYRHPGADIENFVSHFRLILPKLLNKQVFIMGDFNINLVKYDSHTPTTDFVNTFFSNNFLPCITHPTRVSKVSSTVIDNIFTNVIGTKITCGNILTHISDHFPQFAIVENANISYKELEILKSDYSSFNEKNFLSDFSAMDFNYVYNSIDVDCVYNKFLDDITSLVEKHVPTKRCTKKELKLKAKPWINKRIQKMMRIRNQLLRKMKKSKCEDTIKLYKSFRNRVANEIKDSKLDYYQNFFKANGKNMKKVWTGIKSILSQNDRKHTNISQIKDISGNLISEDIQMSNTFNEYFVNVADKITKTIPRTPNSPLKYLGSNSENSLYLSPVTHFEVEDIISNLDSAKSIGPYSIPVNLLKILKRHISHPLAELVNQSFLKGIFPHKLKVAKVVSIYKKGDPEDVSNYRPISLLPIFSKIYERLMYKRLYSFVICKKIIYPLQFGFQQHNSVDHALISMTEAIKNTLDNKRFGCGIFIDLQKAFDTVSHRILLAKLEHYGIRGNALEWFRSYLTDRIQYVSINGKRSHPLHINCGVPQGSVLGPLLFLLFINDLPNVSRRLKFYLFADDTNIYYDSDTIKDLTKKVNNELKYVKRWLDANKLSLNITKTNYIIFHSSVDSTPLNIAIKIGKKHIAKVKYIKFLGVLLDEHLTWRYHITELSKKLARTCGILFKVRGLLPRSILIMLYNALFLSFVQYGIIVWGQTFGSYLEPLSKLQKRAVRAISHQTFLAHSLPIFKDLKLLRIDDIFKSKLLTFVYESINKLTPVYFHDFFCTNASIHSHNTKQSARGDLFLAQRNTLQYGLRSIRYTGQNCGTVCRQQ